MNKLIPLWSLMASIFLSVGAFGQNYVETYYSSGGNPPGAFNSEGDIDANNTVIIDASISTNQWSAAQAIPFTFNFFGSPVTHFRASGNGLVSFDTTAATGVPASPNAALPSASLPDKTIAAFWDEFTGSAPTGSNDRVYTKLVGTAPNRQLAIKWYSYEWGPGGDFAYIAVILEEGTDKIYVVEQYTSSGLTAASTTVGIQVDGTTAFSAGSSIPFLGLGSGNTDNVYYEYEYFAAGACLPPSGLSAANITSSSADISWTSGGATDWEVEYGVLGFTPGTGTRIATTNNNPFALSGLSANTSYDIYVRDSCAVGDVSAWTGPLSITTLCASQLSGVYTINSASPTGGTNFNSFSDAAAELNTCGVSGAVTFNVAAGTYSENLHLMDIAGVSSSNTVTFDGSDSSLVILTYSSANDTPTVYLEGADYVTLTNMTIENTSTSDGWGVLLQNSANNNTVDMCHVKMPVTSTTDIIGIVATGSLSFETSSGDNANFFTVSNSLITGGESGVHLEGTSTNATYNVGNSIIDNVFRNQDDHGIEVGGQTGLGVIGNDIDNLVSSFADAIYLTDVDEFTVSGNRVVSPDYGIYINDGNDGHTPGVNSMVVNNMVISTSDYGIYLNDIEYVEVYHNSVIGEPALQVNDQNNALIIRNNIFYSTADYAVEFLDTLNATDDIDYNLYYSGGANTFEILTDVYVDLAAWQAGNPSLNTASLEGDPVFLNPAADLHLAGTLANNAGDPTVGVTVDIDGDTRSGTSPDIGADEYTPPTCGPSSNGMASNITSTSADLSWTAGDGGSFNIEYGITGYTQGTGTSITGASNPYTLIGLSPEVTYDFYIQDDCGANGTSPWAGPYSFTTLCASLSVFPWVEDFETSQSSIPTCWENETNDDADWIFRSGSIGHGATTDNTTGTSSGYYAGMDDSHSSTTDTVNNLLTPPLDLTGLTTPRLNFYYFIGNDATLTSKLIIDVYDGTNWNMNVSTITFTQAAWLQHIVDLTPYTSATTRIRFRGVETTDFNSDISIDDVTVEETPSCVAPTMLGATNITDNSAEIYWTPGGASDWNVEYGPTGFTPGTGTMLNVTNDTILIPSLTAGTGYEFYVRDSCAVGDVSAWVGPLSFTTAVCAPSSACTFTADLFDSFGDGWNGNEIGIMQNGVIVATFGAGFTTGNTFGPVNVDLCDGIPAYAVVTVDGSFNSEVSFNITDPFNTLAASYAGGSNFSLDDTLATFAVSCTPPACVTPSGLGVANIAATSADLYFTPGGASDFNLEYGTAGFTLGTGTQVNATNDTVSISGLTPATSYEFYVRDSCAVGNVSNWAGPFFFNTGFVLPQPLNCTSGNPTVIFTEEFETVGGWTGNINGGNGTWEIPGAPGSSDTGPDNEHSGPSGSFMNYEASNTSVNSGAIVSPAIDLSQGQGDAELSFWMHAYGAEMGTLTVSVGNSPTGPFTSVFTWSGQYQTSGSDPWVNIGVDLSAYVGQIIYLEFHQLDDQGSFHGDMSIDLVEVSTCLTCPTPGALGAFNVNTTGADVFWTTGGASDWNVQYGPAGFNLGTGTMLNATNDTLSLTGLSVATDYEFYVRDSCAVGDVSPWAGPFAFTTLCAAFPAPYVQNFNNPSVPNCWSAYEASGSGWEFGQLGSAGYAAGSAAEQTGNGGYYAWIDFSGTDDSTTLEMYDVDVSSLTTPALEFKLFSQNTDNNDYNIMYIEAWDGSTWNQVDSLVGDLSGWASFTYDLSSFVYSTNLVRIRFRGESGGGSNDFNNDLLIDDVEVKELPSCSVPTALGATSLSATSAEIFWTTGGASDWNVEYGPSGFTPGTGTMLNTTNDSVTLTGLTTNLAYEFYVRDSCAVGDVSAWVGPFTFGTVVACDNFDIYSTGLIDPQSVLINGWAGAPGDAEVSTDFASSGTQSLKIYDSGPNAFSDVVAEIGTFDSGIWNVAMDIYIPSGNGGYYNILHNYTGASNVWAIEVLLDANGTATVDEGTNGSGTIGTYTYTPGAWNTIEHIIDLDNDTAYIIVNGVTTSVGWQFSLGSSNFGDQFNAVNFYSSAPTGQTPLIYFDDFCVTSYAPICPDPTALGAVNIGTGSADIFWTTGGAANWNVEYGLIGFTPGTGTMMQVTNDTVTLTGLSSASCYDFYVQDSCAVGNVSSWVGPYSFCTQCTPFVAPYSETFDTDQVPTCWSAYEDAGSGWEFGQPGDPGYAAATAQEITGNNGYFAWIDFSGSDDSTTLEMFDVDVSALTVPALQFYLFSKNVDGPDYNDMIIEAWDGSSWVTVDSLRGDLGGWQLFNYDLTSYTYSTNLVRLRFRGESGGGSSDFHNDLIIDDVSIIEFPPCNDPTNLVSTGSTTSSVDLAWMSDTNIVSSVVEYGAVGFPLGSGTMISTPTPGSITISGLTANTCYDFYVLDSCSAATNWIGPITVCTKAPCTVTGMPTNLMGDSTGCGGGGVTLSGTPTGGQRIAWLLQGNPVGLGNSFTDTVTMTTIYEAAHVNTAGSAVHLGPMPSIATAGFGNFSNGQYITVMDTLVIDYTTVRANGFVRAQVIITDGLSVTDGGNILQRGEIFTTDSTVTGNYQVPVGVVLTPGTYFIGIDFLPGTLGSLFRATGGAVYPYVEPGLMSIDSVNFSGPRYYYTFDLVIQQACLGTGTGVMAYVPGANAGTSDSVMVCGSNSAVDLTDYLGVYDFGGVWLDDDATGALTDSLFDATAVTAGNSYQFTYGLPPVGGCAGDSATITVTVEQAPFAGNDTTNAICISSGSVQLRNYLPGATTGGSWNNLDGPANALAGTFFMVNNVTPGTYRFSYTVQGTACPDDSALVTMIVDDVANAGTNATDTICDTATVVNLNTYLGANYTAGGIWIDVNASGGLTDSLFNVGAVATNQTYEFRYLVDNACGSDSASVNIFVCTIGLSEYITGSVDVYPNPTRGTVFVETTSANSQLMEIEVYSMSGQLVIKRKIDGNTAEIDLSDMADGLYNIKLTSEEGVEIHRISKE